MSYDNQITLNWQGGIAFEATDVNGHKINLDGSPDVGGQNLGTRPMDMILMGLAGCAAIDVVLILTKARFRVELFEVQVSAQRSTDIPRVFTDIMLTFRYAGKIPLKRFEKAVALAIEKYCSVAAMLSPKVKLNWQVMLSES